MTSRIGTIHRLTGLHASGRSERTSTPRLRAVCDRAAQGLTVLVLAAGTLWGPATTAVADPPLTVAEAKVQIEHLEMDVAAIDQAYAGVKEEVDTGTRKLSLKQADVRAQTAKVGQLRKQVGQVALAQFQNRTIDTTAQLFLNADTEGFLSQISTVEKISENQNALLQSFQSEQATLAALQRSAETDLATLAQQQRELAELRATSDDKLAESKAVLAKLSEQERRQIAADERRVAAEAAKAARAAELSAARDRRDARLQTADRIDSSAGESASGPTGDADDSTRGAKALAFAKQQVGKRYSFGGTGPDVYDCSGLTGAAWRAAGVSLPRTSQQQISAGRAVSKEDLQPGDLVFFYSDISHVALYAGGGTVLQAARPSKPIGYASLSSMPFAGARRVG